MLRMDFYAASFVAYVFVDDRNEIEGVGNWETYRGKTIRESELSRNFMNCLFIFLMQLSLTGIIGYFMFYRTNKTTSAKNENDITADDPKLQYDPFILITRFICAIILHLQIEPEICQSINLMRFTIYRTGNASRKFPQFSVATMQFIGAIITEIINLVVICNETNPSNIVQNLLAFGVICQIDDFYVQSLKNNLAQGMLEEGVTLSFRKLGNTGRDVLDVNKSCCQWCLIKVFHLLQALYDSVYFYFMPYLAIVLSII